MRRPWRIVMVAVTAAAGLAGPAMTGTAYAATTGSAYVWADQPTASSYTPDTNYQYNSTGSLNTITRHSTGFYTVILPGLGEFNGTVLVSAYGGGTNSCKVSRWGPGAGFTQRVDVRCFTIGGSPADHRYTMSFTSALGGRHAWLWANEPFRPINELYTPIANFQANSTGRPNTVVHLGTGQYAARVPIDAPEARRQGVVVVTPYGTGPERCQSNYGAASTDDLVRVLVNIWCFAPNGAPADAMFTLTWVDDGNVIGRPVDSGLGGYPSLYVDSSYFAGDSAYPSGVGTWFVGGGGPLAISHLGPGQYAIHSAIDGRLNYGNVQVVTQSQRASCSIWGWNPIDGISLSCYALGGNPADASFALSFVGAETLG